MSTNLTEELENHKLWISGSKTGKRANLSRVNLSGVNLSGACLYGADLSGACLYNADLYGANLSGANLSGANLADAYLFSADLSGANLYGANLSGADLTGTKVPYPIYQFFIGAYSAVASPHELRIGCEVHDWQTWLDNYKTIGKEAKLSKYVVAAHGETIQHMYKLLVTKTAGD